MKILSVNRGPRRGHYATIEDALSAAEEGDILELADGKYEEVITITVPGITIRASEQGKAEVRSHKGENSLSVITVDADEVTLSGLKIKGSGSMQNSQEPVPAVLVLARDVEVIDCEIYGSSTIGLKTYEMNTKVTSSTIRVGKSAIIAEGDSACIRVDGCRIQSKFDTGIWLNGASKSGINETGVENCGHTCIWIDAAPCTLKDVMVNNGQHNGIVLDWPHSSPISDNDYLLLSQLGHSLENVAVKKCKDNGLHVFPGVRVVCTDCEFSNNGSAGAFFQGPDDEDEEKEALMKKRAKNCVVSVISKSKMKKNALYGVESEESGLVELIGQFEFDDNKRGDVNKNVVNPAKRARSVPSGNKTRQQSKKPANKVPICVDNSSDDEVQIIDSPKTPPATKQPPPAAALKSDYHNPIAIVTQKSGVKLPKNWPPSLYFVGDMNVSGWPGPDKLEEFYLTNHSQVNRNVVIEVSSKNRGLGLLAAKTLRKGQVVGYYSGLLRRQQVIHDSEYVAKWRPLGEEFDGEWEIDALWGGNEMRFANYPNNDEKPNMKANCIRRNNLQVIAFKALIDIKKGTELLWDYGPDYLTDEQ